MTVTGKLNHNQKYLSNLQIHTDSLEHQDFQVICLVAVSKTKVDLYARFVFQLSQQALLYT